MMMKWFFQSNRFDICCCVQVGKKSDSNSEGSAEGTLYKIFQHAYAPFILSKPVRAIVFVVFMGWLCSSIAVAPKIEVGLDQELSMPEDSYMLDYFRVSTGQLFPFLARVASGGFIRNWPIYCYLLLTWWLRSFFFCW